VPGIKEEAIGTRRLSKIIPEPNYSIFHIIKCGIFKKLNLEPEAFERICHIGRIINRVF